MKIEEKLENSVGKMRKIEREKVECQRKKKATCVPTPRLIQQVSCSAVPVFV